MLRPFLSVFMDMVLFPGSLLQADVPAHKGHQPVAAQKPGGNLGAVAQGNLIGLQIGGDHRRTARQQPVVQNGVQRGADKLGGKLRPQIINQQQVAGGILLPVLASWESENFASSRR